MFDYIHANSNLSQQDQINNVEVLPPDRHEQHCKQHQRGEIEANKVSLPEPACQSPAGTAAPPPDFQHRYTRRNRHAHPTLHSLNADGQHDDSRTRSLRLHSRRHLLSERRVGISLAAFTLGAYLTGRIGNVIGPKRRDYLLLSHFI
nr:hypothetical protein B0A51_04498 [Rachicladosporium sp. CCFEE 5018]